MWITKFGRDHGYSVVPHGLRKNAAIKLREAGCSTAETASISGQSLQMVEHYGKRFNRRRTGAKAMDRLEETNDIETGRSNIDAAGD